MNDQDLIGHLIDIEHQAASLLLDAQVEADKRLAHVRSTADATFKIEYEKIVQENERSYQEQKTVLDSNYQKEIADYHTGLEQQFLDKKSFTLMLDSLFFAGK